MLPEMSAKKHSTESHRATHLVAQLGAALGQTANAKPKIEEVADFEDMLGHVGGWNTYQKRLLLLFFLICIFFGYIVYTPILYLYEPDHFCKWPEYLDNSSLSEEELIKLTIPLNSAGEREKCRTYNVDFEKVIQSGVIEPDEAWPLIECQNGWKYNFTGLFTTAVSDMNWVCNDSWKGPFTQSMFSVGAIIGTLYFGYTSDHYGRLWTVMVSNGVMAVAGFLTPFCNSFIIFVLVRFVTGLSFQTFFTSFYMLILEYVSIEKRSLIGNLSLAVGLSFGGAYLPWLIKYLEDWKIFHHIVFGQMFVIFTAPLIMDESIRWLASQNKIDKCVKVAKRITKINGKTVSKEIYESFRRMIVRQNERSQSEKKPTVLDLFRTRRLRRHTILLLLSMALCMGAYDGHLRNIVNLNYSIYITFTISSLLELPSDLLAIWGLDTLGRRWSASLSMFLSGVCMVVCGVAKDSSNVTVIVFSMLGRFFVTYALNSVLQMSFEVLPTQLRGQGNALANVLGQVSIFFSPYIVYSTVLSPRLPFFLLGLFGFLGALTSIFLPETAEADLPNTVAEAEDFGKEKGFFHVPSIENFRNLRRRSRTSVNVTDSTVTIVST